MERVRTKVLLDWHGERTIATLLTVRDNQAALQMSLEPPPGAELSLSLNEDAGPEEVVSLSGRYVGATQDPLNGRVGLVRLARAGVTGVVRPLKTFLEHFGIVGGTIQTGMSGTNPPRRRFIYTFPEVVATEHVAGPAGLASELEFALSEQESTQHGQTVPPQELPRQGDPTEKGDWPASSSSLDSGGDSEVDFDFLLRVDQFGPAAVPRDTAPTTLRSRPPAAPSAPGAFEVPPHPFAAPRSDPTSRDVPAASQGPSSPFISAPIEPATGAVLEGGFGRVAPPPPVRVRQWPAPPEPERDPAQDAPALRAPPPPAAPAAPAAPLDSADEGDGEGPADFASLLAELSGEPPVPGHRLKAAPPPPPPSPMPAPPLSPLQPFAPTPVAIPVASPIAVPTPAAALRLAEHAAESAVRHKPAPAPPPPGLPPPGPSFEMNKGFTIPDPHTPHVEDAAAESVVRAQLPVVYEIGKNKYQGTAVRFTSAKIRIETASLIPSPYARLNVKMVNPAAKRQEVILRCEVLRTKGPADPSSPIGQFDVQIATGNDASIVAKFRQIVESLRPQHG